MAALEAVEAAILATAKAALGNTVREYASVGGVWSLDALKRALQGAPGVYVGFLGARRPPNKPDGYIAPRWGVYCVQKGAVEAARRKGSAREIGAEEMALRLVAPLDGLSVAGACRLQFDSLDNLFQEATFQLGGAVYGVMVSAPALDLTTPPEPSSLDDFITFDHRIELDPDAPVAHDRVTLPQ